MIEVYVDDFMSLVIPISKSQLQHTVAAVMMGIHDAFPAKDEDDGDDPISENKLKKLEGQYSTAKTLLGFDFDGIHKTMWREAAKWEKLLTVFRGWIRTGHRGSTRISIGTNRCSRQSRGVGRSSENLHGNQRAAKNLFQVGRIISALSTHQAMVRGEL